MDVGGVEQMLDLTIDQLAHLDEPLRDFAKEHKRPEVKQRFADEGPGWAALDPDTVKRKLSSAEVELMQAPKSGRTPAKRLLGTVRQIARAKAAIAKSENIPATGKRRARLAKQAEKATRRLSVLRSNLEKQARRFEGQGRFKTVEDIVDYVEREGVRASTHREAMREARAYAAAHPEDEAGRRKIARRGQSRYKKAESGRGVLGELANSIGAKVTRDTLTLFSKAYIGGIHNSGGTAGNGAAIPARKFLEWTAKDFEILTEKIALFAVDG